VLSLDALRDPTGALELLCIGAHSDDIEIGCGGTILRLLNERPGSRVRWVVLSASAEREAEARMSAAAFLAAAAQADVEIEHFRESYFPDSWAEIKDFFNELRHRIEPDLILCHHRHDEHQDHRTVGRLAWNTWRRHIIAEYEILKYDGDLGHPNVFVPLSSVVANRKLELIFKHFNSQGDKHWFRPEALSGLMALRGVEAGVPLAEAFHVRKLVV
jgi:LmbE family N-acetylglucosaminyl deacetylase